MFQRAKDYIRSTFVNWIGLKDIPRNYFGPERGESTVQDEQTALTLPAFFAAIRWYQTRLAVLPIVTYTRKPDGSRERAREHPAYRILHDQPNPSMTRNVFLQLLAKRLIIDGNFFAQLKWEGIGPNRKLKGIYPLPVDATVREIVLDDDWNKSYIVQYFDGTVSVIPDADMFHVYLYSNDGIQGIPLLDYAYQSLGLHKQVQTTASSYYKNAMRSSIIVNTKNLGKKESLEEMQEKFEAKYMGPNSAGRAAFIADGEVSAWPGTNASDSELLAAISAGTDSTGQWTSLTPLQLGKLDRGTYSNLAADNTSSYQRSLFPIVDAFELEANNKIFHHGDTYCEFLTEAVLRGDPKTNAEVDATYLKAGVYDVNEVRERLNLPPKKEPIPVIPEVPNGEDPVSPANEPNANSGQQ